MKTSYASRQWHDLENLKAVTQKFNDSTSYKSKFTSVERISELQEIVHLTTGALESYSIEDEETCNCLRNELSTLRGYLVGLVGEFEDSIYRLERLTTSLHVSPKEPVAEIEPSIIASDQSDIEVVADLDQPDDCSDYWDFSDSTLEMNRSHSELSGRAIRATGETREMIVRLLLKFQRLGFSLEWRDEGCYWQTSLGSNPTEEALELMRVLFDHGVWISPGKRFLKFSGEHGKKRVMPDSDSLRAAFGELDLRVKFGDKTSKEIVNESGVFIDLIDKLQRRGYKVEKQASGKWLTSLSDYPDEESKALILKLLDLGLEIWPGKGFMM